MDEREEIGVRSVGAPGSAHGDKEEQDAGVDPDGRSSRKGGSHSKRNETDGDETRKQSEQRFGAHPVDHKSAGHRHHDGAEGTEDTEKDDSAISLMVNLLHENNEKGSDHRNSEEADNQHDDVMGEAASLERIEQLRQEAAFQRRPRLSGFRETKREKGSEQTAGNAHE